MRHASFKWLIRNTMGSVVHTCAYFKSSDVFGK